MSNIETQKNPGEKLPQPMECLLAPALPCFYFCFSGALLPPPRQVNNLESRTRDRMESFQMHFFTVAPWVALPAAKRSLQCSRLPLVLKRQAPRIPSTTQPSPLRQRCSRSLANLVFPPLVGRNSCSARAILISPTFASSTFVLWGFFFAIRRYCRPSTAFRDSNNRSAYFVPARLRAAGEHASCE